MPQFDLHTWVPQLVWLFVSCAFLYFLMARIALPRVSSTLEQRYDRIANDLAEAQSLKAEAEKTEKNYQISLVQARAQARAIIEAGREKITEDILAERASVERQITLRLQESYARIRSLREDRSGTETSGGVESQAVEAIARELSATAAEVIVRRLAPDIKVAEGDGLNSISAL